jgi:hypothetical protein
MGWPGGCSDEVPIHLSLIHEQVNILSAIIWNEERNGLLTIQANNHQSRYQGKQR